MAPTFRPPIPPPRFNQIFKLDFLKEFYIYQTNIINFIFSGRSKSVEEIRPKTGGYVPRQQKFNHLLDTTYDEILTKKAQDKIHRPSPGNHLFESFRQVY